MLITFEGLEGSGKRTHMGLLADRLVKAHKKVINTREPGFKNSRLSGIFRHLILESDISPIERLFLRLTDRAGHFHDLIGAHREGHSQINNAIILSDSGPDNTVAFQGFGLNLAPIPLLIAMNALAMQDIPIAVTILLDAEPAIALNRSRIKGKYNLQDGKIREYFDKVRAGYLHIAKEDPKRVAVVNTAQTVDRVHEDIWNACKARVPSIANGERYDERNFL